MVYAHTSHNIRYVQFCPRRLLTKVLKYIRIISMDFNVIKLYFQFFKSTIVLNWSLSIALAVLGYIISGENTVIYSFALFLMSVGFIFSILIKESTFSNKDEYYFYYNFGITKIKLFITCELLNVILGLLIIIGNSYAE